MQDEVLKCSMRRAASYNVPWSAQNGGVLIFFRLRPQIVENSIHLPTMDEEEHGFNQPCMFPTLVFISAS